MITRSGFVNIVGPPNSGKSTLINNLIGKKISIVSSKSQTTRFCVRGILNFKFDKKNEKSQIIFVDTPGIFKPKRKKTLHESTVSYRKSLYRDSL